MTDDIATLTSPIDLQSTLAIYETQRQYLPNAGRGLGHHAPSLRSILAQFDVLFLDGYGVLNVGDAAIPAAAEMLAMAKSQGVEVFVLTNGASKDTAVTAEKYRALGLDIPRQRIISSRDAMIEALTINDDGITCLGVADGFSDAPDVVGIEIITLDANKERLNKERLWEKADAIGIFGSTQWSLDWQVCLEAAIAAGKKIYVANPDVAAPHPNTFSREPGFWVARACRYMTAEKIAAQIRWFGKPHAPVFALALERLQNVTGRDDWDRARIAMVGDTLHTDILGGSAAGLKTILITGHGLFRNGGMTEAITTSGIMPDFIVTKV